jgi:hypothetical protein
METHDIYTAHGERILCKTFSYASDRWGAMDARQGPTGTDKERRGAIEERGAMAIRNHALLVVGTGHGNFD